MLCSPRRYIAFGSLFALMLVGTAQAQLEIPARFKDKIHRMEIQSGPITVVKFFLLVEDADAEAWVKLNNLAAERAAIAEMAVIRERERAMEIRLAGGVVERGVIVGGAYTPPAPEPVLPAETVKVTIVIGKKTETIIGTIVQQANGWVSIRTATGLDVVRESDVHRIQMEVPKKGS